MKSKFWKIAAVSLAGLVLLSSLSAVIYCGAVGAKSFSEGIAAIRTLFGRDNDVFCRKNYTVSDQKAQSRRDEVIATLADRELTNGQLQVSYWMNVYDYLNSYGQYAAYAGLDYSQPLEKQACSLNDGTWQQFFLSEAIDKWHTYQAMALLAQKNGLELTQTLRDNLANMRENMTKSAQEGGFESLDAMIRADMGPGCTFEDYYAYMETYYLGYMYYTDRHTKLDVTDELLEAYFSRHESELAESKITKTSGDLVDIRQILIQPAGGVADENDDLIYTDEAWEEAEQEARKLLEQWQGGKKTEASFAELAAEHSDIEGADTDGGLIESVFKGYLTDELDEWCFAEGRKAGDCELVRTKYGYHIVYFAASEAEWRRECRNGVVAELAAQIRTEAKEQYVLEIDYSKIVLGEVKLGDE